MENKYKIRRIVALVIIAALLFIGVKYFTSNKTNNSNNIKSSNINTKTALKTNTKVTNDLKNFIKEKLSNTSSKNLVIKEKNNDNATSNDGDINEDGIYQDKDSVAKYIKKFNKLPKNYITKKEAMKLGWNAREGNLWKVTNKMSIGGDYFSNAEGLLPKIKGVKYYECDIDYNGGARNAKRIIFSNKGKVYYTSDHYKTFTEID